MKVRTFLHVDMDAFFAAIEQRDCRELQGKPVIISTSTDKRGVVTTASYEARIFGVRSAMPAYEAKRLCPQGIFLPVDGKRYRKVSLNIFAMFERFTPYVERISIDEAFLDVTGMYKLLGEGPQIASQLKITIKEETGLTASIGVASNKFLAKIASDMNKPDGMTVVPKSREEIVAFLAPLPVDRIWGVGKVTRERLGKIGIQYVRDLQSTKEKTLRNILGRSNSRHLMRLAMGEDESEIKLDIEGKNISREHTFSHDCTSFEEIKAVLNNIVDDVGARLRKEGKFARSAKLKLRWGDFHMITRQRLFEYPCCDDFTLRRIADYLLKVVERKKPVRLIGFGVNRLTTNSEKQLTLFKHGAVSSWRREKLSRTVDAIRSEYGVECIKRGSSQNHRNDVN